MYSSGARLPELRTIAALVALLSNVCQPSREAKRTFSGMIRWFDDNWDAVQPHLQAINLLDESGQAINGMRELFDRSRPTTGRGSL
jgi:hypothetical protein